MAYKAVIAGASGLIGSNLVNILLQAPEYDTVLVLVRKLLPISHKKLRQLVIDFDELEKYKNEITGHAVFSCLGTTLRQTPDKVEYRKIDQGYPLQLARLAFKNMVGQFHLVSSMGANEHSRFFYPKIKGQTERDIKAVGLPCLHIYQPSFLSGPRDNPRFGEGFALAIMKLVEVFLIGSLKKFKSIPGKTVARAMYKTSLNNEGGIHVHPSDKIKEIF